MKIIVQKFGGTAVATTENRKNAAKKIINCKKSGFWPVVVVSAIGREGAPYATDTLFNFAKEVNSDIELRELDLIMSCGETISSVIMANTLKDLGYQAIALTGGQAGIYTDHSYGNAEVIDVNPKRILKSLKEGKIPVVAGFQGIADDGDLTTLGRGGSDFTAAILAEALNAHSIEIYTDVDGIMTADPRLVPNAKVLKTISYEEVFQIADQGAKVIYSKAVEIAKRCGIPVLIKNAANDLPGTLITSYSSKDKKKIIEDPNVVITGITYILDRTQISVENIDDIDDNLLHRFAKNNISLDVINIFPSKLVFTVDGPMTSKAEHILDESKYNYKTIKNCSKISAVGSRMKGVPGVIARIYSALKKSGIEILQTADSHTTISCIVRNQDTVKAVIALHDEFELWKR
ncbi:MAG: aspartate kinase [Clostridia bacterium]|nr:aspartate kinase [Clostridia bacterium]